MKNYNYDPSMQEDKHQEKVNEAYYHFRRLHAIEQLMKRHEDLTADVQKAFKDAEDYLSFNLTSELETELPKMEG